MYHSKKTTTLTTESVTNSPNARRGVLSTTYTRAKINTLFAVLTAILGKQGPVMLKQALGILSATIYLVH